MLIDNGRITWIGSTARMKAPRDAEMIDLSGKFVMPGLINLHGHPGGTIDLKQDPKKDLIFKIRAEQHSGRPTYSRVFSAGQGFTYSGSGE